MARLARVSPVGVPQHIIQRGNNRQPCFKSEDDMKAYLSWLKKFSKKYSVDVHAWVLMTNHVHLLCTPKKEAAISQMMQAIGRMYVRYFNDTHDRTGGLWEGRFKSCLIQSERYLLELYRYIELNPVRAGMVDQPSEYCWSSYGCNALGMPSDIHAPHAIYLLLGKSELERLKNYRDLLKAHCSPSLLSDIRDSLNKGLALGDKQFTAEIEANTSKRITSNKTGRPRKAI